MIIHPDTERLAHTFTTLCEIDSPSRREGNICQWLKAKFKELGADCIYEDGSAEMTGSECGNLIIRFNSTAGREMGEGFFLSCHMDTVEPAKGVEVLRTGDIFTSKGGTILGADDKAGLAAVIELLTLLQERSINHPTIEVIITTCEEIGLLGAKNLEFDQLETGYGYALDSCGIDHIIIGAPAANRLNVWIKGKAAHAGLCPEEGINALVLAAEALTKISLGRLDRESTRNFGLIQGGVAANIVPEEVLLKGEVRSHSQEKLERYTREVIASFEETIEGWQGNEFTQGQKPQVRIAVDAEYPALSLEKNSSVLGRIDRAVDKLGRELTYAVAGGGSDANIFCSHGLPTAIVATGMDKVHTLEEQQDLKDLVRLVDLLYCLVVA